MTSSQIPLNRVILGGRLPKDDVGGGEPVSVLTIDTVHQKSAPTNARIWRCLPA